MAPIPTHALSPPSLAFSHLARSECADAMKYDRRSLHDIVILGRRSHLVRPSPTGQGSDVLPSPRARGIHIRSNRSISSVWSVSTDPGSRPFGNTWTRRLVKFIKAWTLRESSRSNEKSRTYTITSNARFTAFPEEGKVDPEACSFPSIYLNPYP